MTNPENKPYGKVAPETIRPLAESEQTPANWWRQKIQEHIDRGPDVDGEPED
jgi:hypothetical protein